jgi:hypothetical protein
MKKKIKVTKSSGNAFADIECAGRENPNRNVGGKDQGRSAA